MITIYMEPVPTDPELAIGGHITLERADGRSLWRQRFVVKEHAGNVYVLAPVTETGEPL